MADTPKNVTACLLIIGNEILSGRTQDVNLNWIATKLVARGIKLAEARVVPDIEDEIVTAVRLATSPEFIARARVARNPYGDGTASHKIVGILKGIEIDQKLLNKEMAY